MATQESMEIAELRKLYSALFKAPANTFPKVGEPLMVTTAQGVYVIFSPKGLTLHVGRTLRGKRGLAQRLNNHLHGQSSFTLRYMDGKGAKLRRGYCFKFIPVRKARTRALLEAYATAHLCPKHLGLGKERA